MTKRVLIIDDEPLLVDVYASILQRAGYDVATASDGIEAIAEFGRKAADVVVTDILMQNQEGIETIIQLRRLSAAVGIIAVTGGGQIGDLLKIAIDAGADQTLKKPISAARLVDAVESCAAARARKVVPLRPPER